MLPSCTAHNRLQTESYNAWNTISDPGHITAMMMMMRIRFGYGNVSVNVYVHWLLLSIHSSTCADRVNFGYVILNDRNMLYSCLSSRKIGAVTLTGSLSCFSQLLVYLKMQFARNVTVYCEERNVLFSKFFLSTPRSWTPTLWLSLKPCPTQSATPNGIFSS